MRYVLLSQRVQTRSIGQRLLRFWIVVLLVGGFSHNQRAGAEEVTLKQIRSEYLKSIAALKTVHAKYTAEYRYKKKLLDAMSINTGPGSMSLIDGEERHHEWAIDGHMFLTTETSLECPQWFSFDGQQTWLLHYAQNTPTLTVLCASKQRLATMTDSRLRMETTPGIWLGIYYPLNPESQSGEGFGQMLAKPSARLVGEVNLNGHPALHTQLTVSQLNNAVATEYPIEVWFDRSRGYLPRKIILPREVMEINYVVDEFSVVEGGWFPTQMTFSDGLASVKLTVEEFSCGVPLPVALFQPKLPRGCRVFQTDSREGREELSAFFAETDLQRHREENGKRRTDRPAAKSLSSIPQPMIEAAPSDGQVRWPVVLVSWGMGGVLLLIVWWYLTMNRSV